MMRKSLCLLLLVLAPVATSAHAGKHGLRSIDFGNLTCGQFIDEIAAASEDDAAAVLLWIDGYLSGVSGDTTLNWKGFEAYSERLVEYCAENRRKNLLQSARKVGIER